LRNAVVNEPRGSEAIVGALLCDPVSPKAAAGVIFFNNVGFLGMCGHGTIGLVASLAFLGRIEPGEHIIETPVGDVLAKLDDDGSVSIHNIHSYRLRSNVIVNVPGYGEVQGDIAYGGNWFFLVGDSHVPVIASNIESLLHYSKAIKAALVANGITGKDGAEIDHIEVFGTPVRLDAHSKNFVLCPGAAYDRSPCGTGLSAKLSCLAAQGKLAESEEWRQESIIGTLFCGSYKRDGDGILPTITGRAYVTGDNTLLFNDADPLKGGISL
jgi:4-hydroxyproline epimerase